MEILAVLHVVSLTCSVTAFYGDVRDMHMYINTYIFCEKLFLGLYLGMHATGMQVILQFDKEFQIRKW